MKQLNFLILLFGLLILPTQTNAINNLGHQYGQTEPNIAQLIVSKGLDRINDNTRKDVITDVYSVDEKYVNKQALIDGRPKSRQERKKTITGRPSLDGMNVDELYKAFATRFDFFIDNDDSTGVINDSLYALIKFKPKSNLSNKTVTDAFVNRPVGKVYLNLDNYEIVRVEGEIVNHFTTTWKAWWSPISFDIDVYEFGFSIDYTTFNNMVIEKNLTGMVDYEVRNRGVEKHTYTLSNYRMRR